MEKQKIIPYLMFNGHSEEAINKYLSVFNSGEVIFVQKYKESKNYLQFLVSEDEEDKILHAAFSLFGQTFFCSDRVGDDQTFKQGGTISLAVNCESETEIERWYDQLSEGGNSIMPLQDTFWAAKYGVLEDKYGITWHLNYEKK